MKCEPSSWTGLVPVNAALPCIMSGQLWLVQWMTCDRCDRLFTHLDAPLNPCSAG